MSHRHLPIMVIFTAQRDPFFKILPNHIFGNDEAEHFKFRLLIDTQEC